MIFFFFFCKESTSNRNPAAYSAFCILGVHALLKPNIWHRRTYDFSPRCLRLRMAFALCSRFRVCYFNFLPWECTRYNKQTSISTKFHFISCPMMYQKREFRKVNPGLQSGVVVQEVHYMKEWLQGFPIKYHMKSSERVGNYLPRVLLDSVL